MPFPKKRLLTPGPTQVPETALLSLARQVTHHRTPESYAEFAAVLEGLKDVFQTRSDVVVLAGSGTAGMEAAMVNLVPRGRKAIVLNAGVFAQRWAKIAAAYEIDVVEHRVEWGKPVEAADVAALLKAHPDAVGVFGTLMESSTGVAHDVRAIAKVVAPTDAVFVVDAISGAGVQECRMDAWGIDVLVVGGQKALMLPPGLAIVAASAKAWAAMERCKAQAFYLNLLSHRKKLAEGPTTPWTPAHTLIGALHETLKIILARGMDRVWSDARTLGAATRAGLKELGWECFAARPADGMTAAKVPDGIDAGRFLKAMETDYGVKLASGQLDLKGKIIRIAHMGIIDELDILSVLSAMELTLAGLCRPIEFGQAVGAASRVMFEAKKQT
ncbi:MAG: alanine--glyoxylate aminotransferase family protein [Pirellulales bacterium]